jgi:gentisate 1,2-dioxygenase
LRNWVVRNLQTASLTATGMLVIHVRAGGPAVTVIDGQRAQREEGDFFVVPPGAMLSVETQNETVVFSVLEVRR